MDLQGLSKKVLLVIMDGYGLNPVERDNAIFAAKKPNLDYCFTHYPLTTIEPGGEAVGLPKGVSGNSEVGHLNLGAGRPVRQDLVRINEAITLNTLKDMPRLQEIIQKTLSGNKRLHLMGLLSDGGVHAHIKHLEELLNILKNYPDIKVFLHAFMDGRDTAKNKGIKYTQEILQYKNFTFASMQGRSIGMDRDRRWDKIELAYKTMIGLGDITTLDPATYIQNEYNKDIWDEFITPVLFEKEAAIAEGDSLFFFNYRPDRARQITLAFNEKNFKEFPRPLKPGYFLCMTPYVPEECPELPVLFDKEKISGTLSYYLSQLGLKQFKIAETEKYAHVTYFFNGGEETPFPGEDRVLIPSPREVATYDLKPEMNASLVTDELVTRLQDPSYSFYLVNYANADMVGHTGNFNAAVKAVEAVDACIGRLLEACLKNDVTMILCADHGNADQMTYDEGGVHTSHSAADVPFAVVHAKLKGMKGIINPAIETKALKDVAPSILYYLGIKDDPDFTGKPIIREAN